MYYSESLQYMLNALHKYTEDRNSTVNVQKPPKIVVLKNRKCINNEEKCEYNGHSVQVVNQFNYL